VLKKDSHTADLFLQLGRLGPPPHVQQLDGQSVQNPKIQVAFWHIQVKTFQKEQKANQN
jgi:hypothetical protein